MEVEEHDSQTMAPNSLELVGAPTMLPSISSFPLRARLQVFLEQDLGLDATAAGTLPWISQKDIRTLHDAAYLKDPQPTVAEVLTALSNVAATPGLVPPIFSRFRPILPDLFARWI